MVDLHLSDDLQQLFNVIYMCCQDEENNRLSPISKLLEVLKSGNIPSSIVSQISEICWQPSDKFVTKYQFFSALKLAAAYQGKFPITSDTLNAILDLPSPRFYWQNLISPDLIELKAESCTDSDVDSDTLAIARNGVSSTTASDSPTPTNSIQDKCWANQSAWDGLIAEEQRQLLGTEEESSDRHSSSGDEQDSMVEIWTINREQREYYTKQFRLMQPDTNGLLGGTIARQFFEKSGLPITELSKIWELSDITKDGALTLEEFNTAMHLVVLRRNQIPLPTKLPISLIPINDGLDASFISDQLHTDDVECIDDLSLLSIGKDVMQAPNSVAKEWTKFTDSPTSSISSPGPKPVNFDFQKISLETDSNIFHPVAVRLTPETTITMTLEPEQSIVTEAEYTTSLQTGSNNSAIQRPLPKKINLPAGPGALPPPPRHCLDFNVSPSEEISASLPCNFPSSASAAKTSFIGAPPPPPPRPFQAHVRSSSLDLNTWNRPPLVPPRTSPSTNVQDVPVKEEWCQRSVNGKSGHDANGDGVDPFCSNTHAQVQSASLYDNHIYENCSSLRPISPNPIAKQNKDLLNLIDNALPVQPSNVHFSEEKYNTERDGLMAQFKELSHVRKHGAFEVYRKPKCRQPVENKESIPTPAELNDHQRQIKKLQEENVVLLQLCQELSEELTGIREQKLALILQLEKQQGIKQ